MRYINRHYLSIIYLSIVCCEWVQRLSRRSRLRLSTFTKLHDIAVSYVNIEQVANPQSYYYNSRLHFLLNLCLCPVPFPRYYFTCSVYVTANGLEESFNSATTVNTKLGFRFR